MAVQARKGKNGIRYRVLYRGVDGKQHSGGTYATKRQADAEYGRCKASVLRGNDPWIQPAPINLYRDTVRGKGTVAGYAASWIAEASLQPSTRLVYEQFLKNHILPAIGGSVLADITASDIRAWFRRLEAEGKSDSVRAKIKTITSSMFQTAAEDGKIPTNVVRGIRIKQGARPRRKALTVEQYRELLRRIPAEYQLLVRTIVETGLRWEEATGLIGENIEGQIIHVRQTLSEPRSNQFIVKDCTKNAKARVVKISKELAAELNGRKGYVFLRPDGTHIYKSYWHGTVWQPALKAAGLDGMGIAPRDLRRTHATWIRAGGASLETVRDRLGHSNVAITDRYLGEPKEGQDEALDAFQAVMGAIPSQNRSRAIRGTI